MGLEGLSFNPSESVTYLPENTKQNVSLTITNSGQSAIIYKWKSTRPGLYKMRPVFGRIAAGDHANVSLIFKGIKPGATVPLKDHFTCIMTVATSSSMDVQKMWKNHKNKREIANQTVGKHKLRILYKGHNDQQVEMTPLENDISEQRNKVRIKKGKGLVDEEDEKPPAAAAAAGGGAEKIQLVFREQACPLSDSDEDEKEDDSDKEKDKEKEATKSVGPEKSKTSVSKAGAVVAAADPKSAPTKDTPTAKTTSIASKDMKTAAPPSTSPSAASKLAVDQMKTAPPAKPFTPAPAPGAKSVLKPATASAAQPPTEVSKMKTAPPAKIGKK